MNKKVEDISQPCQRVNNYLENNFLDMAFIEITNTDTPYS
jgi:hypothetical protein